VLLKQALSADKAVSVPEARTGFAIVMTLWKSKEPLEVEL